MGFTPKGLASKASRRVTTFLAKQLIEGVTWSARMYKTANLQGVSEQSVQNQLRSSLAVDHLRLKITLLLAQNRGP